MWHSDLFFWAESKKNNNNIFFFFLLLLLGFILFGCLILIQAFDATSTCDSCVNCDYMLAHCAWFFFSFFFSLSLALSWSEYIKNDQSEWEDTFVKCARGKSRTPTWNCSLARLCNKVFFPPSPFRVFHSFFFSSVSQHSESPSAIVEWNFSTIFFL